MKIVTSGRNFLDIDAYAGCVAYAELLNLMGEKAVAFSSATINESVTATIRSWGSQISSSYSSSTDDRFILIDVSEPEFLDKVVEIDRVEEVIDHHVGHEDYWFERIGDKANIEFIGAACTQVYEKWVNLDLIDSMSELSARLLICGIIDNTLNFKASITTERDKRAHHELLKIANLPNNWTEQYLQECEESIFDDLGNALIHDTKIMTFKNIGTNKVAFGQLVIWDGKRAIHDFRSIIEKTMDAENDNWFVNIVSLSDGCSYFMISGQNIELWAEKILDATFIDRLAKANRLWLRKEIVKKDAEHIG